MQCCITFCTSRQWQSFSATESTLCYFAAFLADQVSYRTVKWYMAGIRFFHIKNNLPDPFWDAPLLHLLLRGIKRSVGLSSQRRHLITMSLLQKLKSELGQAPDILPRDKLVLWSAFTLAFFAFLQTLIAKVAPSCSPHQAAPSVQLVRLKYTWPIITSIWMAPFTYSSLASTSPEPKSPQHFIFFSNTYTFQQSFMPPTAFELRQPQQQPRLAYLHGSFKLLVDGPAIALLFTSRLPHLFFRKCQAC